ncbi:MAG: hypothetical protein DRQ48_09380 [Gammaproteobacteria bacterium]|nr:MAG: hypothetical protein DRQ48_09380 [Gammaproteobacteria bacterium]
MGIRRSNRQFEQDPFTDLLFNSLLAFTLLFLITILFLNPPAKKGIIDPKAEFIITVKWDDNSPDDVDTWVRDPSGATVWFRNNEVGLMHLDRDDRGIAKDSIVVNGIEVINPLNQEVITIRGNVPGEYIVNVHYYNSKTLRQANVEVRGIKVNPRLEVIYYGTLVLENKGDEKTAFRFTIDAEGNVSNVNTLFKSIVEVNKI